MSADKNISAKKKQLIEISTQRRNSPCFLSISVRHLSLCDNLEKQGGKKQMVKDSGKIARVHIFSSILFGEAILLQTLVGETMPCAKFLLLQVATGRPRPHPRPAPCSSTDRPAPCSSPKHSDITKSDSKMILSLKVGNPDERLEASLVSHNNSVEKVQMPLVSNNWHTSGELLRKCKGAALRDTAYIP